MRLNQGSSRPQGIAPHQTQKVGILGAGMMGAGIAYVTASKGIPVVLKDVSIEQAEKGKAYSQKLLDKQVSQGRMTCRASGTSLSQDSSNGTGCRFTRL